MSAFKEVWSDDQREAVRLAYFALGIDNRSLIGRLARAGELQLAGETLPAFDMPDATVRDIVNKEKRRREGKAASELAKAPPQDAVEVLRRRLVSLIDHDLARLEKDAKEKPRTALDAEQLRKLARATRELDALPAPGRHSTKRAPGRNGQPGEAPAKDDSMAGQLASALRAPGIAGPDAATDPPPLGDVEGERESTGELPSDSHATARTHAETGAAGHAANDTPGDGDDGSPGAYARAQLAGLRADAVSVGPAPGA